MSAEMLRWTEAENSTQLIAASALVIWR